MEIKDLVNKYGIIGVISNYKCSLKMAGTVKDLGINNSLNALKMVGLDKEVYEKKMVDLSLSELWKIDLATKLNEKIIIIGNLASSLNHKDLLYMQKLLLKLHEDYGKKIVIIDEDVKVFFNVVKYVVVLEDKQIIFATDNFFDKELYMYVKMPEIISFLTYVNKDGKKLQETIDIYELIKDIYRNVS